MKEREIPYKIYLEESEMPDKWYNVRADMKKKPAPLLNPGTLQPMTFEELQTVFCDELVKQELDDVNPYIDIPANVLAADMTYIVRVVATNVNTGEVTRSGNYNAYCFSTPNYDNGA